MTLFPARVYVMAAPDAAGVKIGRAADVDVRRKALQIGSPVALKVAYATDAIVEAAMVETFVHRLLEAKRISGEWFDVTEHEARAAIDSALEALKSGKMRLTQTNFRYSQEDQQRINELRKVMITPAGNVPNESYIWRQALREMYTRQKAKKDRK